MADSRMERALENREAGKRPAAWEPPQSLPSPNPQPGVVFRWIRISFGGQNDPSNASSKFREGWEPVKASDHPELKVFSDPTGRFKDNVEVGGLLLCKAPAETMQQRAKYYQQQATAQLDAVDNSFMRQKDPRTNMDLFKENRTEVSFGKGSK